MNETSDATLRARRIEVSPLKRWLSIRRAAFSAIERQDVFADADERDVTERAAKLFAILQNVLRGRERVRLAGQIAPAPHQSRPIHVNQGVSDVQVFGDKLIIKSLV